MVTKKRATLPQTLMGFAQLLSKRSTCARLQVGCIVASEDGAHIYSYGYNGNARKFPNRCDSAEPGKCGCIHAEANALIKVSVQDSRKVIYCTCMPCKMCAKMIVNSGASKVYFAAEYRLSEGRKVLTKAGIKLQKLTA
jgi:dCMP deaminase